MCLPSVTFQHQNLDNNLCAYFSSYHFLGGNLSQESFVSQVAQFYKSSPLGLSFDDAKAMASGGNDPAAVAHILEGQAEKKSFLTDGDFRFYNKILIALRNRPHFITLLKCPCKATWWNYDSLLDAPEQIAIRQFIEDNPAQRDGGYFVSL